MNHRRKLTTACSCGLAAAALLASTLPASAEFTTPIAIANVRIVVEPGVVVESGTIVLDEGRIVAVGSDVSVPPTAEVVDGGGLIAYAGFIDAHVHLGIPEKVRDVAERIRVEDVRPDPAQGPLAATRFANRRGIRPELRAIDLFAPDEKALAKHRGAGFTVSLIAPRDGIFSGTSDAVSLSDLPIRRNVLRSNVAMHGSFATGEDGNYPRTLLGLFAQFRQALLDARWHARMQKYSARHPATSGRTPTDAALDALQPLLGGAQTLVFEANTENEIHRALNLAKEFELRIAISGAKEAWKVIDRIKAERAPLIVSLKFDEEPEYGKKKKGKRERGTKPTDPDDASTESKKAEEEERIYEPLKLRKERRRLWEEQVDNVIRLHEAKISFSLRTRDFDELSDFWKNVRLVLKRGLPEEAIVAALTTTPASFLELGNQLGTIRPGLIADLTLMTAPISEKKAKVRYVFIDGKEFKIEPEKKGDRSDKERDESDADRSLEAAEAESPSAEDEAETSADVTPEPGEDTDRGPTYAVETKVDREPAIRTGGNVLIRNATIIPVSSATRVNASILIRSGRIEAIGDIRPIPEDVTVVDATGRFIIPGFVDCHSHLGVDGVNESSLSVSAEVRIADLINPQSLAIYRAAAGGTTTHHVMHGSADPIGGQNAILKLKYERPVGEMLLGDAPPTIKFALGENVTQANWQAARGMRFPNSRMGVEAVLRTALEAGREYADEWRDYEQRQNGGEDAAPPRRDLRLDALSKVVQGGLTVHCHCYRSDEILRLLAIAEDYGFRIGTLQHVLEGYRIAPEIARHGCGASTFSNLWAYKIEAYGAIPHNAALMTEHGINVSVNSDSPNTIRYLGQEAAKSIRWGGLDEIEAIKLVTINPAMQLQIDDRVGSLDVGKDGDLAIFNGHPLNTFSKCVMTLIDGEVYFEDPRPEPTELCDRLPIPGPVDQTIPQTPHRAYAIVGATVHTISGPVIENGTVVIVEDRIQDVGKGVAVPPGAGVIDGSGLHVYPGLIDAGSVIGLQEISMIRATRDERDIADFSPHLTALSAVHSHSEHIRVARTTGITTALTVPSGGRISGQSAVIHLDGWTAPEMAVVDSFALHMNVPSLPVHLPEDKKEKKKRREEHEKSMREFEEFIKKAKLYEKAFTLAQNDPSIEFETDLRLEAMVPYVRGEKPVVVMADEYKEIVDAIEFAEKHELQFILGGGREAWKLADVLAEKDIAVIFNGPLAYPRGAFEPWDSVYRAAGELDRAGVRFCFASGDAAHAFNLPTQVGMAVAHGLPRERAEFALTLGAARIFGIDDRVGSIEPGKIADLIVSTDTPLQTVSRVTHMFIVGKPVELTSIHTENYEKFKNRPAPVLPPLPDLVGPPNLTRG